MGFLNPLFLFGGLAAAVPILLHFVRRHRAEKVEFPTLLFLRKIDKRTIRYRKLRHLLLLLMRVLAFLFLALAFMRPYRDSAPVSAGAVGRTVGAHVLVLDNSMSMRYRDRWEKAKAAAADIVRRAGAGDRFAVIEFSDRSVIRMPFTSDASAVLEEIGNIPEPGDRPTRYIQALRAAEKIARESGKAERTIHLISDFQKSGWIKESMEFQLRAGIGLDYEDLGTEAFDNLAIQNVRVLEEDRDRGSDFRIQASIVDFGDRDRQSVSVGLTLDGRKMSEKTVSVAKSSRTEIEFPVPGLKSGEHPAILEIDDPDLERDNLFYLTIDVRQKTPVLVVEEPAVRDKRAPSFFLARALNVDRLSPYALKSVSPQEPDISGRLLIWNAAPPAGSALRTRLEDFVKGGGGMILVLGGSSTTASEFNRSFGAWLPVTMEETASGAGSARTRPADDFVLMTDIRTDHPVFQPFAGLHSGTFSGARFYSHARIVAGPGTEVPARFDNGDPALVSIASGNGRVLVFASSVDDTGNDLPLHAVYAPFWQQMLRYLEGGGEPREWMEVGDIIDPAKILLRMSFHRAEDAYSPGEALALLDPARRRLEIPEGRGGVEAETAGFYEIRTAGFNTAVAVNTPALESDLTHGNAEEMTAAWTSGETAADSGDESVNAEEKNRSRRLWVFLLLAALLFLVSESLVSGSIRVRDADADGTARNT